MAVFQTIFSNALWIAAGGVAALAAGKKFKKSSLTSAGTLAVAAGIMMFLYSSIFGLGPGMGGFTGMDGISGEESNMQTEAAVSESPSSEDSRMADASEEEEFSDDSQEDMPSEDELRIRVSEHSVYVGNDLCENEDDLTAVLEERYHDNMQVILIDDYAVSQDYRMVRNTLDELAMPYYETVLK